VRSYTHKTGGGETRLILRGQNMTKEEAYLEEKHLQDGEE
jgi:hypothetical protein